MVLEGTRDEYPAESATWAEYEFKAKPGDVSRTPPLLSPYHRRLDWLMWFLPLGGGFRAHPWLLELVKKLLVNDASSSSLLRSNPFINGAPPTWIRGVLYRYSFAESGERDTWTRERVREWLPPQSAARSARSSL